jgi:hypothetical protein
MAGALYHGTVMHARLKPKPHRFRTRVFSGLFDVDALPELGRKMRLFSHNRFNLFSLRDGDFGDRPGETLRASAERRLAAAGFAGPYGKIELLCFPRMLGYAFNPISLFFCRDFSGRLMAVIHEVHNTFGERHSYVLPVARDRDEADPIAQRCGKAFHVSPFIGMDADYSFRLKPPAETFALLIRERDGEGDEILRATLTGKRARLTDAALLGAFFAYPFMTAMVMAQIHWHALRLWLKGVRFHRHPAKAARRAATAP